MMGGKGEGPFGFLLFTLPIIYPIHCKNHCNVRKEYCKSNKL